MRFRLTLIAAGRRGMGKRNIYKDIVCIAVGGILIMLAVHAGSFWMQQRKTCEAILQSQSELTEHVVKEIGKLEGVYGFVPTSTCNVKIRLQEYVLETTLTGVDVSNYPLKWKAAQEEIRLANTPVLFFGQESFAAFADNNGNNPGRSRIAEWIEKYQELQLTVTGEDGRERGAKIGGIVEEPSSGIYMGQSQMAGLYGAAMQTTGGCVKIRGESNLQSAKEILSQAGFQIE